MSSHPSSVYTTVEDRGDSRPYWAVAPLPPDKDSKEYKDGYSDGYGNKPRNPPTSYYFEKTDKHNYNEGYLQGRADREKEGEDELENATEFKSLKNKGGRKHRKSRKTRKSKKHSKKTRKHRK